MQTPAERQALSNILVTSLAWSETGNTLFPRSTLTGREKRSHSSIILSGGNAQTAPVKNLPPWTTFPKNSSGGQSLVRLHLPFPVM